MAQLEDNLKEKMAGAHETSPSHYCAKRILKRMGTHPEENYGHIVFDAVEIESDDKGYCHEMRKDLIEVFMDLQVDALTSQTSS
ncbi:hypothetical protein HOA55_04515 [archaeon]|jgi:hypothetical protein|nr:hypothetical protein [archaeon]MBT3577990.1 hypothetical protein [archaeon]MBT6820593.1 hypothetical protein [archaeon]MBT6956528.1 hypothetical protein [archaeon]MBT7025844.1 hypothetical protein [archaeon]